MSHRPALFLALATLPACADLTAPQTETARRAGTTTAPAAAAPAAVQTAIVQPVAQPAPPVPEPSGETVGAAHVLVAYVGARRADPKITRTKDEARKRAADVLVRAKKGEDFAALAKSHSDDPSGPPRGGDLGRFARNAMVKPFADAAFALKPGQVSEVVETEFGFHVIKRTQ